MVNTKELDIKVRDILRNNLIGSHGIESDIQIIATAESQPMDFPFIVISLRGWTRDYNSTDSTKKDYQMVIGIVDEWVDSRNLYEKNADLMDATISVLESDHEINNTFDDTLVTEAQFKTITAKAEQGAMPFGQIELTLDAWRIETT